MNAKVLLFFYVQKNCTFAAEFFTQKTECQIMAKHFLFIVFASAALSMAAAPMSIEMTLDRDSMLIGDQAVLTLRITHSPDISFEFPEIGDTLMPKIEVLRRSKLDTILSSKDGETNISVERRYTITCFDAGVIYTLPQFEFVIGDETISSNQLTLKVMYPPMDSTWRPNDLKPPIEYPYTFAEALPWIFGVLLLLAIAAFLIYYLDRRRRHQPIFFKPKPKEPAHVIALRELQILKGEQLWQNGKIKEFHTKISEILRNYIENRFAIPAMEQTSDEIVSSFEANSACAKKDLDTLRQVFYISDLVKFAKYSAAPDENETIFLCAKTFVEQTKIVVEQNL